jgi:dienelactone hydrolase
MNFKATILLAAAVTVPLLGPRLQAASTFQFEYTTYTAPENAPSVLVAVVRSDDLGEPASVDVASVDGTATAGEDYEATSLTVEFAAGEGVQTFRVPLLNDAAKEPDERLRLTLSNPSEGSRVGAKSAAVITIKDNDPGVQFTWKHFWGHEVDGALTVEVERGNDGDLSAFTVDYATSDQTAKAGQDYTATTGTLEFAEGETTKTITIPVTDDAETESREQFQISLTNATGPGGIGGNNIATLLLHDTTGHEPRGFGPIAGLDFDRAVGSPLLGAGGGSSTSWFELFGVESSADLDNWFCQAWIARTPADPSPTFFYSYTSSPPGPSYFVERQFFRLQSAPLVAAWPPPSERAYVWRTPRSGVVERGVGYTERWVTDPTRRNRYGISDNSSFRVTIWYPASPGVGATPKQAFTTTSLHFWMDNWDYPAASPDPDVVSYSFPDVPFKEPAPEDQSPPSRHPIVLYSHAGHNYGTGATEAENHAEYLASRGYIVIAPNHYDCWTSELPDGSFYGTATTPARNAAGFQDRMRDFEVLLDALPQWQESDPILAGRLDLANMAAMGFQWGAGVAAELCRTVDACKAGVLMDVYDGSLVGAGTLLAQGAGKPLMFIQWAGNSAKDLYSSPMTQDAVWFQLAGSTYNSLYAWYAWDNAWMGRPPEQNAIDQEVGRTIQAYADSFLGEILDYGGGPAELWKGPSEDHPRVINYQRK